MNAKDIDEKHGKDQTLRSKMCDKLDTIITDNVLQRTTKLALE